MDIEIKDLRKVYGTQTVVDIKELTIHAGELIGLVGNNGAGKTTLMRLILDLIKADEGFVMSNGVKVNESEAWKQYTGSFIDGRFLIDFYTPEEYFTFIGTVYGLSKEIIDERLSRYAPRYKEVYPRLFRGQPTKDRHHWRHAYQSTDTHFRRTFQLS